MINSRKISDLHPKLQAIANTFLMHCKANGIDVIITSTLRDYEAQDALYAIGRTVKGEVVSAQFPIGRKVTNSKGGESFHNFRVAFDCVPVDSKGHAIWDSVKLWQEIGQIGIELGLEWGGNFVSFKDKPHFQLTNGLSLKDFQSGKTLQ